MVWFGIARFILRQRVPLLAVVLLLSLFMAFKAAEVRLSYHGNRLIPESDTDYIAYRAFLQRFGVDGNLMVVGVQTPKITDPSFMQQWLNLTDRMREIPGVTHCYSVADLPMLVRNDSTRSFEFRRRFLQGAWAEGGSRFGNTYERLLINMQSSTTLMAVALDPQALNDERRLRIVAQVEELAQAFGTSTGSSVYYSGLPYIRTVMATTIKDELIVFLIASILVTSLMLFLFFRSMQAVLLSLTLVAVGSIWALGLMSLMGYQITLISGLIPALMVVIGVPNGVYLVNKYHTEFRKHANKIKALTRTIERIGVATLITNATTAVGFLVFYFTESSMLQEFGLITGVSVLLMFVISIVMIPALLSFLPEPGLGQIKHLENQRIRRWLERLTRWIEFHRLKIWVASLSLLIISLLGIWQLRSNSYVVDDLPRDDRVYTDLRFLENQFGGVMPMDVVIDAGRRNLAQSPSVLQLADGVQALIAQQPVFGPPMSIVELIKASNQAYFDGDSGHYQLPNAQERAFVLPYLLRSKGEAGMAMTSRLIDSTKRYLRISYNMADVGTDSLQAVMQRLRTGVDSLATGGQAKVTFTGNALIFLKGNQYLIRSLAGSIGLAIVLIALMMGLTYRTWKAVVWALLPNLLPLMFTAGIMGWLDISIKPSTVLIFSIVLGIAVDDCIHYLARYFQEVRRYNRTTLEHLRICTLEAGGSMLYTSIILFFGFIIFAFSDFGGTQALGLMSAVTLLLAMIGNLVLLPTLILAMEGWGFQRKPHTIKS
jgi:predicted RND superfamily exporter protein